MIKDRAKEVAEAGVLVVAVCVGTILLIVAGTVAAVLAEKILQWGGGVHVFQ